VEEIKEFLMCQLKLIQFGSGRRRVGRYMAGNTLWPLEELRNVRNPPFVADPEFIPCGIHALDRRKAPASANDPVQLRPSKHLCQHGIPLPHLVAGLPWLFAGDTERPIVPETDFVPLDLYKLPV
jgi:hypothetical protein